MRAREAVGDLPVGVSVVALGQENAALRELVARQRARGERAFYHFVDDATLGAIASGRFARWFPQPCAERAASADPDVEAVNVALASVVEVIRVVGGTELARRADAIELPERMMPDARLTPARYLEVLRTHGPALQAELRALHAAVLLPSRGP